jgi:hypothetical protein
MATAPKGKPSNTLKSLLAEIRKIRNLLIGRGSIKEKNAEIMAHVMFGVYVTLWVSTCSKKIGLLQDDNSFRYLLDNYSHLPRVYLAVFTFTSLVCLWWWYTNVFLAANVFHIVGMSSWELLLLATFALAYDTWGEDYRVFGVIFFIGMMLLALKFGATIVVLIFKGKTRTAEFKTLVCGAACTFFILLGFFGAAYAAKKNSLDGTFQDDVLRWSLVYLVLACIVSTLFSVAMLKYQQYRKA